MVSQLTTHIQFDDVSVRYAAHTALDQISLEIPRREIFAIIGPANSGKTTLLKCINRTIDFIPTARVQGLVTVSGQDVFRLSGGARRRGWRRREPNTASGDPSAAKETGTVAVADRLKTVHQLRRKVGMVFPLPVGLPLSVFDNVAYAPRRAGMHDRSDLEELVERCLRQAMLWDEVKDRLQMLGTKLSGGQQQRLTLARALSHQPEVLCLDEFSIAIDPVTTMKIEDVLLELKQDMTIVLVTNLVQQAHRLADRTAFVNASKLIEVGETERIFDEPEQELTRSYVTGGFG